MTFYLGILKNKWRDLNKILNNRIYLVFYLVRSPKLYQTGEFFYFFWIEFETYLILQMPPELRNKLWDTWLSKSGDKLLNGLRKVARILSWESSLIK